MLDNRMRNEHLEHRRQATMTVQRNVRNQRWEDIQEGALGAHYRDVTRHLDFETGENVDEYRMLCAMKKKECLKIHKGTAGRVGTPLFEWGNRPAVFLRTHPAGQALSAGRAGKQPFLRIAVAAARIAHVVGTPLRLPIHYCHALPFLLSMEGAKSII